MGFLGLICHVLSFFVVPLYFYFISSLEVVTELRYYGHFRTTRVAADSRLHDNVASTLGIGDELLIFGVVIFYGMIFMRIWGSLNLLNGIKRVSLFVAIKIFY